METETVSWCPSISKGSAGLPQGASGRWCPAVSSPARSPARTTNSSPPAGRRCRYPHRCQQAAGDLAQQGVADGVAGRVVDRLEAIQVKEQQGELALVAFGVCQCLFYAVGEQAAIGEFRSAS